MNCPDIALILDDGDWRQLPDGTRRDMHLHLARCAECARDWQLHTGLSALPMPVLPATAVDRLRAQVVTPAASRSRSVYATVGGIVAVAAAAALFVYRPHGGSFSGPLVESAAPTEVDLPAPMDASAAPARTPAPATSPATSSATSNVAPAVIAFTVRVMPLAISVDDALARGALQDFHTSLLAELRAIPGLQLVEASSADPRTPDADFEVTSNGSRPGNGNNLRVTLRARRTAPPALVQPFRADFTPSCVNASDSEVGSCNDADSAAKGIVNGMRTLMFPVDSVERSRLEAEIANSALDPAARFEALRKLTRIRGGLSYHLSAYIGSQHPLSTPGAINAAVALAAAGPTEQRVAIWQMLRGVRRAELVDPMIATAQSDPDARVRKEALMGLVVDFPAEPRARQALERMARQDDSAFLRALAGRAISGEDSWREYLSASLQDVQRRPEERIEALLHEVDGTLPTATRGEAGLSRLLDADSTAALGDVLPAALSSGLRRQVLVNVVANLGGLHHPAITDGLIRAAQLDLAPADRQLIVQQLTRRNADARVRTALQKIATSDPDAKVRELALGGAAVGPLTR